MCDTLSFVIPVRHPQNMRDIAECMRILGQTMKSISNQSADNWRCIIVANRGTPLPSIYKPFTVTWTNIPPNAHHDDRAGDRQAFYDSVRSNKGERAYEGLRSANGSEYIMVVDDDDFVHRHISRHAEEYSGDAGWYVQCGFVWPHNGAILYPIDNFCMVCGTSFVVSVETLYELEQREPQNFVSRYLGAHIFLKDALGRSAAPLKPLPFRGAIYRIGGPNSHSASNRSGMSYAFGAARRKGLAPVVRQAIQIRPKHLYGSIFGM